jgi:hypothetical protein
MGVLAGKVRLQGAVGAPRCVQVEGQVGHVQLIAVRGHE